MPHKRSSSILLASAIVAVPGLAMAAASSFSPSAPLHVRAVGTIDMRNLAASAANVALLKARSVHPVQMPVHRYPNPTPNLTASSLPVMGTATVSIFGKPAVSNTKLGFTGIYEGSNAAALGGDLEPPDQGLAVNNGQVAEIVNDSFQVFDATGKPLISPVSTYALLAIDASSGIGDPHVEFDAASQRWFIDEYLASATFNGFVLAVSATADPLGSYVVYKVDADTAHIRACKGSCFPDYPQVGYDQNGFFIAADLFSNTTGRFVAAAVYALPKASLVAGAPLSYQYFLLPDFVVEPSIPAAAGQFATVANGTEFLMTARQIYNGSPTLRVYAISNTNAIGSDSGALTANSVDLTPEPYTHTVPSKEPNQVGPYGQSVGATTSPSLDGGYNAFGGGVKYLGGVLYAALTTGSMDANGLRRDVIAWFKVKADVTKTKVFAHIARQGYIVPPSGYSISYPGFALGADGTGIIGTTITNPDPNVAGGYPSTGFVRFNGQPDQIYRVTGAGAATDDGFTGYNGSGPAGVGRWGDFSSATVDPVSGILYVGNEFIPDDYIFPRTTYANWGTFITHIP